MRNKHIPLIMLCGIFLFANNIMAHNTTQVHPRITRHAIGLIEDSDQTEQKFSELYRRNSALEYIFWGLDLNPGTDSIIGYEGRHVTGGVVMEDHPESRVVDHFYHSKTGRPLDVPIANDTAGPDLIWVYSGERPSNEKAREMFNKSVELYGYNEDQSTGSAEPGKPLSYWFFGRALHHLEDMDSPAHVHNDAHLTKADNTLNESDDYEAHYVPLWRDTPPVVSYFAGSNIVDVTGFDNIWSTTNTSALSLRVFNAVRFQAELECPLVGEPTFPNGQGELSLMFPDGRLHFVNDAIFTADRWQIDGVGDYYCNYFESFSGQAWWETEDEGDTDTGYYYLEVTQFVQPAAMRDDLMLPYNATTNNMVENTGNREIGEYYAQKLLPLGAEYAAGFAQYWYKIVNSPPYLRKVTARQDQGQNSSVVYEANWENEYDSKGFTLTGPTLNSDDYELDVENFSYSYVASRNLQHQQNLPRHINDQQPLTLELEFSEPVQVWENGAVSLNFALEVGGQSLLVGNYQIVRDGLASDGVGEIWRVIIDETILTGLNGKLALTVRTLDKNDHHGGIGASLDGNPGTPARRQATYPGYPWHTTSTVGANGEVGSDAYETGEGDTTHYLLFDTTPPTRNVTGVDAL